MSAAIRFAPHAIAEGELVSSAYEEKKCDGGISRVRSINLKYCLLDRKPHCQPPQNCSILLYALQLQIMDFPYLDCYQNLTSQKKLSNKMIKQNMVSVFFS